MNSKSRFPTRLPPLTVGNRIPEVRNQSAHQNSWDTQPLPFWGDNDGFSSDRYRLSMVQLIKKSGVDDEAVLKAMLKVERHRFVDSALRMQAYEDTSLPIGSGQTISKPNVVARMLALLMQAPIRLQQGFHSRVMEIGTGCGYQAAVLSLLCKEIYSLERIKELHLKAKSNLRPFRIPNIHLLFRDGAQGYESGAPFSGMISAAGAEHLPKIWIDQLSIGGRLVAPVQNASGKQNLLVIDRLATGYSETILEDVHFVPLKSGLE